MKADAYREAGVDIEKADALVERIKPLAKATMRAGVMGGLGGFGGLFSLEGRYKDPVLVSGTDGVGTKLLLAQQLGIHDTIGIDLVAMCVNDIVVCRAEPLFFLDYFATGALDNDTAEAVIRGIAEGCTQAGAALLGGETAEMPGMYAPGHYDLAGFAVGVVERDEIPDANIVAAGDVLLALPSSGLHSNGYSLARKLLVDSKSYDLHADPGHLGEPLGQALLAPTTIYVKQVLELFKSTGLKAVAHITGGGLPGNLPRVLPEGLGAQIDRWTFPPLFQLLQQAGQLSEDDMLTTFNCGVGMVLVVPADEADAIQQAAGAFRLGVIVEGEGVELQ